MQDELRHVHSQLSAVQEEKASLQMEANEQTFHQLQQLQVCGTPTGLALKSGTFEM